MRWLWMAALPILGCSGGGPAPKVEAGPDKTVFAGDAVELAGNVGGEAASIQWNQISGPEITLEDANTPTARFVAPEVEEPEVMVFSLSAVAEDGATAVDFVIVTVDLHNRFPVVSAGPAQTVMSAARVVLAGSAQDEDGTIVSILWRQTSGPGVPLSGVNAETPTFLAPETEESLTLLFEMTATDDGGASASAETRVTVVPRTIEGNLAPMVDAGPDQSSEELQTVTLSGVATDIDGTLASIVWTQLEGPPATLSSTNSAVTEFRAPGVTAEAVLLFELTAVDDRGASVSDRTRVTVTPIGGPNQPPEANAGSDQKVAEGTAVTLSGGGTDPDGQIVSYAWRQLAGPAIVLAGETTQDPTFTAPAAADCEVLLAFELTVTDNEGATDTDTTVVLVNPPAGASLIVGELLDFEDAAGGDVIADGWVLGAPSAGPNRANSGLGVWSTSLAGTPPDDAEAFLRFPMIDLRAAIDPTLAFRMWLRAGSGDGVSLEVLDDVLGWMAIANPLPAYDANVGGRGVWTQRGYRDQYEVMSASLAPWVGRQVCVRIAFRSDASGTAAGAYVDDAGLFEEGDDPDGDGRAGIRAELALGLDPFTADTDGDGIDDGVEIGDGTDGTDPSWFRGAPLLSPGSRLDFEGSPQGAATTGELWQHGVPLDGPARAWSGDWVWATDLSGPYFNDAIEYLYLPRIDLRFASNPTLSFRMWSQAAASMDGLSLEVREPGMGWRELVPDVPDQDGVDRLGRPAWVAQGYQDTFVFAAVSLAPYAGDYLRVRLVFRSDASFAGDGVVIDDVQLHEEGSDPDLDGTPGVLDELMTYGTDPYITDTDGDGTFDGIEILDQTDPLNPGWYRNAPVLTPGTGFDFESGLGGVATTGELWEHAVVTGGPVRAHSGSWAWATKNSGGYFSNAVEYLYLPRINILNATNPTLSFALWSRAETGDGVSFEIEDPTGWTPVAPTLVMHDGLAEGVPSWTVQGYQDRYVLVVFSLPGRVGTQFSSRLVFRSDGSGQDAGAYVDDISLFEETTDVDMDGVPGVLTEIRDRGTDPFVDDTDGDGIDDGPELTAMTDPLDPANYPSGPIFAVGARLTFEDNDNGLGTMGIPPGVPVLGSLWEWGVPSSGPGAAYAGSRVWATNLAGSYFNDAREVLDLPPFDCINRVDPTVSFRLWCSGVTGDGLTVEVFQPGLGWSPVVPAFPPRDGLDAIGRAAWTNQRSGNAYVFAAFSLQYFTNRIVHTRLAFRSNSSGVGAGCYIDELRYNLEASDPDADGINGIINEHGLYGTDPYRADTDGDGLNDGAEVAGGSNPLDPNSP